MRFIGGFLFLIAIPMFLLGGMGIAENLPDGNVVPTLISLGLFVGSFVCFGLFILWDKLMDYLESR